MPKTDLKKSESEDLAELADEALDRTVNSQLIIITSCGTGSGHTGFSAPSD